MVEEELKTAAAQISAAASDVAATAQSPAADIPLLVRTLVTEDSDDDDE